MRTCRRRFQWCRLNGIFRRMAYNSWPVTSRLFARASLCGVRGKREIITGNAALIIRPVRVVFARVRDGRFRSPNVAVSS
jgi:hypothetical protein